ncbi:MAG: septum formation initiator family protein [Bacteroidales bacterium]|jgi:cell division protein FtsB|nr:septum formation initiator family protein [Bacteroidales bacterium]
MNSHKFLKIAKKIVTNRYFIASAIFIVWVGFIDDRNLAKRNELMQKNADLEAIYHDYERKIQETRNEMENLNKPEYIETIAREHYTMKKDNEDIYVVTETTK